MELFPAILIGGPPHSGKSVLAYNLSQVLRRRQIDHYVLRAYPDGEGDWSNEADQDLVREIRDKGAGTSAWVTQICSDIAARQLPLLVDVGGRPTPEQEAILGACSHAILLAQDEAGLANWRVYPQRYDLLTVAELISNPAGSAQLIDRGPPLQGVISGLERGRTTDDVTFQALVDRVASLFDYPPGQLRRWHLRAAPVEPAVDLERLAWTLNNTPTWQPGDLPALLDYLPAAEALALYGRAPIWLYTALAWQIGTAACYQFDPRLGWVAPPDLTTAATVPKENPVTVTAHQLEHAVRLDFSLPAPYLDIMEAAGMVVPAVPASSGVILSGKLPLWLWTALVRRYRSTSWLAVYQPQLGRRAVVIGSQNPALVPGSLVPAPLPGECP